MAENKYVGGIHINTSGFEVHANAPVDSRFRVKNAEGLLELLTYEGLVSYNEADKKYYRFADGEWKALSVNTPAELEALIKGLIATETTGAMNFKDTTATLPENPVKGDMYKVAGENINIVIDEKSAKAGDTIIYNGEKWVLIPSGDDIEDTWRKIIAGGNELANDEALELIAGENVTITENAGKVTISSSYEDTHYESKLIVGNEGTDAADENVVENGNVRLNLVEDGVVKSSHKLVGAGGITVTHTKAEGEDGENVITIEAAEGAKYDLAAKTENNEAILSLAGTDNTEDKVAIVGDDAVTVTVDGGKIKVSAHDTKYTADETTIELDTSSGGKVFKVKEAGIETKHIKDSSIDYYKLHDDVQGVIDAAECLDDAISVGVDPLEHGPFIAFNDGQILAYESVYVGEYKEENRLITKKQLDGSIDGLGALASKDTVGTSDIDNGAITYDKLDTELGGRIDALEALGHKHDNKSELDLIASGDVSKWNSAHAQAHAHSNYDILQDIRANKVAAWDASEQNAKNYTDALANGQVKTNKEAIENLETRLTQDEGYLVVTEAERAEQDAEGNVISETYVKTETFDTLVNSTIRDILSDVEDNTRDIATLKGADTVEGSVAKTVKDAIVDYTKALQHVSEDEDDWLTVAEADYAIMAYKDRSGNVITTTYETKSDASAKLTEAKDHADGKIESFKGVLVNGEENDGTEFRVAYAGEAETATKDSSGNKIIDTYETKNDAAAKLAEAKKYADDLVNAIPAQTDYTVTVTAREDQEGDDHNAFKHYIFTQCGNEIGHIDVPRDLVVQSGTVEEVTEAGKPYAGAVVGDKYIKLVVANQDAPIYIPAKDLVDIYTAKDVTGVQGAEIQVAISNTNEISASLVNGSIVEAKLAEGVKTKLNKVWQEVGDYKVEQAAVANKITNKAHVLTSLTQNKNGEIAYEVKTLTPSDIGAASADKAFNKVTVLGKDLVDQGELTVAEAKEALGLKALAEKDKVVEGDIDGTIGVGKISGLGSLATKNTITNADVAENAAIAVSKINGLGNLATKDNIADADIATNAAIAKTKLASDVQTSLGKADNALQQVEVGTGLTVTNKAENKQTISIDESVVFILDCNW